MAFWRVVLFVFLIVSFGITIKSLKQDKQNIPQTNLSVELQQTKERYQKWEKEQAIKDSITDLRIKMGEVKESFEDYQSRSRRDQYRLRRDLDSFIKKQVRGN